jgi:hypothetical protein
MKNHEFEVVDIEDDATATSEIENSTVIQIDEEEPTIEIEDCQGKNKKKLIDHQPYIASILPFYKFTDLSNFRNIMILFVFRLI